MIDPKLLRSQLQDVADNLKRRGVTIDETLLLDLEERRKAAQLKTQQLQETRNVLSKKVGIAKAQGGDATAVLDEVAGLGEDLKKNEEELDIIQKKLLDYSLTLPNLLDDSVPFGKNEDDNVEIRQWGEPTKFSFTPKDHIEIGESLKMLDFEAASKLSGARFSVLRGNLARLQRALAQFMLDVHVQEHAYQECYVPYLVHEKCLYGTGQLPKMDAESFSIAGEWGFKLIPTAEVPLTNLVRDEVLSDTQLPMKMVAHTPCFRSEAGSYGKDTRGMIRQHQFEKVELVQIVKPENSMQGLEELTLHAETILRKLNLPYRVLVLCSADVGFSARKTYDLEVWLPGQKRYREISSCSNCGDFQARRMQARYRSHDMKKPELVHTLNGSGLAVGRTLIAIMENYQDENGRIKIPEALLPYMGGIKII